MRLLTALLAWASLAFAGSTLAATAEGLVSAARCDAEQGLIRRASDRMGGAVALARLASDRPELVRVLDESATYALAAGDPGSARRLWEEAQALVDDGVPYTDDLPLRLRLASAAANAGDLAPAIQYFQQALAEADRRGDEPAALTARLGIARAYLQAGRIGEAVPLLDAAAALGSVADTPIAASTSLDLGEQYFLVSARAGGVQRAELAVKALQSALAAARRQGDERTESFALGTLGAVAEWVKQPDKALSYSRLAVRSAQEAGALDGLYRWQWQVGRLLAQAGRKTDAITAYRQAVDSMGQVRPALPGRTGLKAPGEMGSVYLELAGLLLEQSAGQESLAAAQADLRLVRETVESLKVTEVQDYFAQDCVVAQDRSIELEAVGGGTAVIYPIIFADRLEVLVGIGGQLARHTASVSAAQLAATVQEFRRGLQDPTRALYLEPGRRLFAWLVEPIIPALRKAGVTTLVFVPDGPLRSVPPAAFHDGERFLIEQFAVSTTLGLSLASPDTPLAAGTAIFASGLSKSVQGFPELPNVGVELENIGRIFAGSVTGLKDERFLRDPVARQMKEGSYAIVHLATHGEFKADYRQSYIITYDDRLTMDALEETLGSRRYLNQPLDLLVLSACETAVGDDRAALGLAGVAIKAGARSAVATLWKISDEAAPELVTAFYQQLRTGKQSKAEALQAAQRRMLASRDFAHPYNWAPFLLVGNWL